MKIVLLLAIVALGFLFQNCGKAGFENSVVSQDLGSSSVDDKVLAAPFPFDAALNNISYMSCPTASNFQSFGGPYFTFRVGGYENTAYNSITKTIRTSGAQALVDLSDAGVTLKPDFLTYMDKNFKTGTLVKPESIQSVLTTHPDYKSAQAQLSFRSKNNLLGMMSYPGSQSPVVANLMDLLMSPAFSTTLSNQPGLWINSFPSPAEGKRNLVSSLFVTNGVQDQETIRSDIGMNYYLTLGFAKQTAETLSSNSVLPFQPDLKNNLRIYGRGFAIAFSKPNSIPANVESAANPNLAIDTRGITEYDLSQAAGPTLLPNRWGCFSYAIVRRQDARDRLDKQSRCPVESYSAIHRDELDLVRKTLPADEWEVNTTVGCVVPTIHTEQMGSCYMTTQANPVGEPVAIFGSDYPPPTVGGGYATGLEYRYYNRHCGGTYRECVNFVTFCFREK